MKNRTLDAEQLAEKITTDLQELLRIVKAEPTITAGLYDRMRVMLRNAEYVAYDVAYRFKHQPK